MTNEIDEKALVREGDWFETEDEINWPSLPGIHFDYTDEPDANQNIASGDLSTL